MEFPISCIKENRSNKRMTTISIAIWTFTVSLISFCLNSKRSFLCGTSYDRLFEMWERKNRVLCILLRMRINVINILTLSAIILIFFTAYYSVIDCDGGILTVIIIRLIVMVLFLSILTNIVNALSTEKMVKNYIKCNFDICYDENIIYTTWNKLLIVESLEQAKYIGEEKRILNSWFDIIDNVIMNKLGKREDFMIAIYREILKAILIKDGKFDDRWKYIYENFINRNDRLKVAKIKAVIVFIIDNANRFEESILNDFLEFVYEKQQMRECEENEKNRFEFEQGIRIFAYSYNCALANVYGQRWRSGLYFINSRKIAYANNWELKNLEYMLTLEIKNAMNFTNIKVVGGL